MTASILAQFKKLKGEMRLPGLSELLVGLFSGLVFVGRTKVQVPCLINLILNVKYWGSVSWGFLQGYLRVSRVCRSGKCPGALSSSPPVINEGPSKLLRRIFLQRFSSEESKLTFVDDENEKRNFRLTEEKVKLTSFLPRPFITRVFFSILHF